MFLARSPIRSRSFDDAERRDDFPQIHRHRLAAGDGEDGLLLDLLLQRVDGRIGGHDALGELDVAARQRLDRVGDLALGEAAHLRHLAGQLLQVAVERLGGVFVHHGLFDLRRQPKRPVM